MTSRSGLSTLDGVLPNVWRKARLKCGRSLTGSYRILAPDLPGFGESSRLDSETYDYAAQTERLRDLLDALGLGRVHLAGSSMGGTLAALLALQHPERVASVALVGAPHGIRTEQPSAMDRLIDQGHAPLVAHDAASFEAKMDLVFEKCPLLPCPIVQAAQAQALRNTASNLRLWQAQRKDRFLLQEHISALRVPTLVLWGGEDRVFDASGAEVLRTHLPQAHISALAGMGHLPMREAPGNTAHQYADFLQGMARHGRSPQLTTRKP